MVTTQLPPVQEDFVFERQVPKLPSVVDPEMSGRRLQSLQYWKKRREEGGGVVEKSICAPKYILGVFS